MRCGAALLVRGVTPNRSQSRPDHSDSSADCFFFHSPPPRSSVRRGRSSSFALHNIEVKTTVAAHPQVSRVPAALMPNADYVVVPGLAQHTVICNLWGVTVIISL